MYRKEKNMTEKKARAVMEDKLKACIKDVASIEDMTTRQEAMSELVRIVAQTELSLKPRKP